MDIFQKHYHMKDKQDKADEKIEEKLHIAIAKVKNKIIGLCLHLKCEVAKKKTK